MRDLWRCGARAVCGYGPVRSGKTAGICEKDHLQALRWPGTRVLWLRRYRASLTNTVLQVFEDHLAAWGEIENAGPSRDHRSSYRLRNGSEIVLGGLDNAERIFGAEYDRISIFEATEVPFEAYAGERGIITRLSGEATPTPQITLDCNPQGPTHWIYQEIQRGDMAGFLIDLKANPRWWDEAAGDWTEAGREYVFGTLGRLTGVAKARLVEGRWVASDGMVFPNFDRARNVRRRAPEEAGRVIIVADDGTSDPFAAYRLEITDRRIHAARGVYRSGMTYAEKRAAVRELGGMDARIVYDAASAALGRELEEEGFPEVFPCDKSSFSKLDGVRMMGELLEEDASGEPGISIDPGCRELIAEFETYERKKRRDGSWMDDPQDGNDHGLDAVRYGVVDLLGAKTASLGIIGGGDGDESVDDSRFWS